MNNLEERTLIFSKDIISLVKILDKNRINFRLSDQLIRSATSVGANYREANETETDKDFLNRVRISKKECKETIYWLNLLVHNNPSLGLEINKFIDESEQLMKILATIYRNKVQKMELRN